MMMTTTTSCTQRRCQTSELAIDMHASVSDIDLCICGRPNSPHTDRSEHGVETQG
jgi:hypothetical protein